MNAQPQKGQSGFTLLEVMIVIVVMAIGAASIRLMVVSKDPLEDTEKTARTFAVWFGTQQDQSLLSNTELGLFFTDETIAVLSWRDGDPAIGEEDVVWEMSNEVNYASGDDNLSVELTLGLDVQEWIELDTDLPENNYDLSPHIIIFPSEEYSPSFFLTFRNKNFPDEMIRVSGDGFNRLEVRREAQ